MPAGDEVLERARIRRDHLSLPRECADARRDCGPAIPLTSSPISSTSPCACHAHFDGRDPVAGGDRLPDRIAARRAVECREETSPSVFTARYRDSGELPADGRG